MEPLTSLAILAVNWPVLTALLSKYRYHLILLIMLVAGGFILKYVSDSMLQQEEEKRQTRLRAVHQDVVELVSNRIENFSTLTAGMASYIKYADSMPTVEEFRDYVGHLLTKINYTDSLAVSFLDPKHIFRYSFTRYANDPKKLVGTSIWQFRSGDEIKLLERAMKDESIVMFEPFNLIEGWSGVAMNCGVKRDGEIIGYVSPVINIEYILADVYNNSIKDDFVFRFRTGKGAYFDRYAVYDGQPIYNREEDPEYFERLRLSDPQFIGETVEIFGSKITIETAYKREARANHTISYIMYAWFGTMILFVVFTLWQLVRSARLAQNLNTAKNELERLSIVASETENVVLIMDAEGNVEWVNDSFVRLNGVTYEELIAERGKNIRTISNSDTINGIIEEAISSRKPVRYEALNVTKEGLRVWESSTLTPIYDDEGQLSKLVIIDTDVTERREAEDQLKEKNKEVFDSINYARRLQEAILPSDTALSQAFNDVFVMYKPKAIVAGDFYWMEEIDGHLFLAVADCTGHGVPGAMVSMVCSNALNKAIEAGLRDPGDILDHTTAYVIKRFGSNESEVRDGMDIALCRLNKERTELMYAGAFNPLYLIRNQMAEESKSNELDVEEVKANKQPVGKYVQHKKFETHTVQLNPQDMFYIFSDGYYDQFGGKKGKKLKATNFKKILLENHAKKAADQLRALEDKFEEWRGAYEQIDDVCVIGVRV